MEFVWMIISFGWFSVFLGLPVLLYMTVITVLFFCLFIIGRLGRYQLKQTGPMSTPKAWLCEPMS